MTTLEEMNNVDFMPTLPNIVCRFAKNVVQEHNVTSDIVGIDAHMQPFVEALAQKFPQWKFVSTRYFKNNERFLASKFVVRDKQEVLGELTVEYSGRKYEKVYAIKNERISKERIRGDRAKTRSLDKAIKLVGKMFGAKTTLERMEEVNERGDHAMTSVLIDRRRAFATAYDTLMAHMEDYVIDNLDKIRPFVAQALPEDFMPELKRMFEEREIIVELEECKQQGTGAVVLIHGNDYVVRRKSPTTGLTGIELMSSETLPTSIKRGVGMLKLVEPNVCIKDIGMRIDNDAFFVAPQKDE